MSLSYPSDGFDIVDFNRYLPVAYKAVASGSNEKVIFKAYAAKVTVFLNLIIIDIFLMHPLPFPQVYEMRNEITAGLIGHHKTFLKGYAATEAVKAELC